MYAKTAHNFSSGGMADHFLFFHFSAFYVSIPPLSLLSREGYYGNEEMTKNDEDTKETWHRRWGLRGYYLSYGMGFLHGEGGEGGGGA